MLLECEDNIDMKRFFDLIAAVIAGIIGFPLMLVIVLLIKLTSKGPVLFKQRRIGLYRREFYIFKFRTMYINTPANIPTHLLENPEVFITPVGKFLRKTSLDELPQLLNILKGDMSLVGPRPALYNQNDLIALREQCGVHKIRPGLTGWAQVNGRDELEIPVKVEYDKYYVENWSMGLDIKILLLTALNVIRRKGVVEGRQEIQQKG
jgi:O-antigen biosynthesis protein WbqP